MVSIPIHLQEEGLRVVDLLNCLLVKITNLEVRNPHIHVNYLTFFSSCHHRQAWDHQGERENEREERR